MALIFFMLFGILGRVILQLFKRSFMLVVNASDLD